MKWTEIAITKELARRLQKKFPEFRIYANKCPSKSKKIKAKWNEIFQESRPPLQPEIDIIMLEPANSKIRAIELKYFRKEKGRISQSFYVGIEQSLALLQWGFDNVALWQLFDEECTEIDIRNYGCKTWAYVHGLLDLPMDFTPIWLIGNELEDMNFRVIQADWSNNLKPIQLLDIDDPHFQFSHRHPNPLIDEKLIETRFAKIVPPFIDKMRNEVNVLRECLKDWLSETGNGLT